MLHFSRFSFVTGSLMPKPRGIERSMIGNVSRPREVMQPDPLDPLAPRRSCAAQFPTQKKKWRLDTNDRRCAEQRGQSDFTEHCLIFERKTQHRRRRRNCLRTIYRRRNHGYRSVRDSMSGGYIGKAKRRAWAGLRSWPKPARTETNQENRERY